MTEKDKIKKEDVSFDKNGNILYRFFEDENGTSTREYYNDGKLERKETYNLDTKCGLTRKLYDAQGRLREKEISYKEGKSVLERYDNLLPAREESYRDEQGKSHCSTYDKNGILINKSISFSDKQGNFYNEVYKNDKIESRCIRYPNGISILEMYDDEENLTDLSFRDKKRNITILWEK